MGRPKKEEKFEKVVEYNHDSNVTGSIFMTVIPILVFISLDILSPDSMFIIGAILWAFFMIMVAILAIINNREVYWRKIK